MIHLNKLIDDLPKFAISAVAFSPDKEQLLIGTLSNGFFSYRKSSFTSFQTSLSDNIFYAQAITKQDHIITANPNLEITKTNIVPIFQSESNNKFAIYYDSIHHQIWSNNYATLNCFDLQHHVQKRQIDYTLSNLSTITLIDRRDDSSMYIGTSNSIYYYKIDSGFHKLGKFNNQATKGRAYCILKQGDSIVWIGTHRGLYKYQTQLNTFTKAQFPDFIVRTLKLTSSGLMLIGTYGNGIYALNENKFKEIALDKFSNLKTTHSFFEDAQGYLWLSSNNGLFRTKLSEITNYVSGKKTQIYYYRYSTLDGLPTNEFNGGCYPPLAVFQDTTVSLPTMNGLLWFKPSTMQTQFTCTELFIDKLVLNDSSITLNDSIIHIPKHHFKLSVFLSSPLWSDENNLLISYKIDNNDWTILRNNTAPIILQNLEGGIRHLYIRKQSGFLESDIKEMHLVIEVPKLIYEYKIFWPFLLAFGLLSVFGTYKLSSYSSRKRKQKLEKLVSEKTKELKQAVHTLEIQNVTIKESEDNLRKETELKTTLLFLLSHDIATPLRYVNMYLSDCTSPTALPIDINDLVDLKISTTNLEYLLDNIVTWVKHSIENNTQPPIVSVNLHKIIVEKLRLFDLMIQRKQNHIHNLVSTETIVPADSFIVSMAIQNILGNAIHHTKNGEIRIEYLQSDLTHQIIISDTGIGLQTPKIESPALSNDNEDRIPLSGYGIGLKIANQLLELINGYIEVKPNDKGIGTMAIIYIRKSNT